MKHTPQDIVLLSTADWDNPFWTNKQHVALQLAAQGHKVLYIDSLGLRRPSLSGQDFKRIVARLRKGIRSPREVRPHLWVWSPVVLPLQGVRAVQALNRLVLKAGLSWWRWRLGIKPDLLWTYNPMTTRLMDTSVYGHTVYHCVDEIKAQPGMPMQEIEAAENELVQQADLLFVTAEALLESRKRLNPNTHYFPNVADYAHFSQAMSASTPVAPDLPQGKGPVVGFIGAISGYKLDMPLIKRMAETHPDWQLVLIGQVGEGDPWTNVDELRQRPNIHFMGPRAYQQLPAYLKGFDVAILPSQLNEYTRSMFPMKFFEYLAAGKPVVATNLHALQAFKHVACIADGHDSFVAGVASALAAPQQGLSERLAVAREMTYEARTRRMLNLINEQLTGRQTGREQRKAA
jgi:glycosyltransferase involved in cell wall biosynthesis